MQFCRKIIHTVILHVVLLVIIRFVTYVRPCGTCIHYANNEPRGIEVCISVDPFGYNVYI